MSKTGPCPQATYSLIGEERLENTLNVIEVAQGPVWPQRKGLLKVPREDRKGFIEDGVSQEK